MGDMIRCPKCQTHHYHNDQCPHEPEPEYIRFDAESWCVVHLRPHSDVVQMTSNVADEKVAAMYCRQIEIDGGHVFAAVKAGVLIAALQKIKADKRRPRDEATE